MSNLLNTSTPNYLDLIGNGKRYQVPPYQRDYSWTQDHWQDLWRDIDDLRSKPDDKHYLGAMVIEGKSDRDFEVIDGQQRLATLSLFALAVIARLQAMAEEGIDPGKNAERALELRNRYIGEKDPASLTQSSRLSLNEIDDAFYQDYLVQLQSPENVRKLPKSNQLLWECFQFYKKMLEQIEALKDDGQAVAGLLSETVARQLLFIVIEVDDQLSAFTVFETLNARGMDLTTMDLLKNHLFSNVHSADRDSLRRRWKRLIGVVGQERFTKFLRYHMLCEEVGIRERQLFKSVRKRVRNHEDVFALVRTLTKRAELFDAFMDPNHEYWTDEYKAKPYIHELKLFRSQQPIPLLFTAWEHLREDFVRILELVSVISFRHTIVCGLTANALESAYQKTAKAVADGEIADVRAVFEKLRSVYVPDEKMQPNFELLSMKYKSQKKLFKYILVCLENEKRDSQWVTDPGTIEHILPESPEEAWRGTYDEDRWEDDVGKLGNLTLLEIADNRKLSNKLYVEKLATYKDSQYRVARQVAEVAPEEWTPAFLEKRQRELAKRAVNIWRSNFA